MNMRTQAAMKPFPTEAELARVDQAAGRRPELPVEQLHIEAPAYGAAHRQLIDGAVDSIARDITEKIKAYQNRLADLQQQVLSNVADAKHNLTQTVGVCMRINDELAHIGNVIEDIAHSVEPLRHVR
jgi:hypothetical protein